jgi:hypothetical protein
MKFKCGSFVLRMHYANPAEITPFPKIERIRENRRQKTRTGVLLANISVTVALEARVDASAEPVIQ